MGEVFPSLSNYSTASQIRNLGLLVLDGRLMFLTFLGLQAELQPTLLPLSDLPSTLPLLGHFGKWLHNNVNPLVIEEKGMFLVVGHVPPLFYVVQYDSALQLAVAVAGLLLFWRE